MQQTRLGTWRRNRITFSGVLILMGLAGLALNVSGSENIGKPVSGDIRSGVGFYGVVFYLPKESASAKGDLKKLVTDMLPGVAFGEDPAQKPKPPFVLFVEEKAPFKNFPVPDASYFKYAGVGITASDIEMMQKSPQAIQLMLVMPAADSWKTGRIFTELALKFAESNVAIIWDSATRQALSREAWKKHRLESWPDDGTVPDLSHQLTIHFYRPDDSSPYLRGITLGMEKFGLPDLVVEKLIASDNRPGGGLINLTCQYLAENPVVTDGTKSLVDVAAIKNKKVREKFGEDFQKGATGKVLLALIETKPVDGDPDNTLIELDFRNQEGASNDEKKATALAGLWGSEDSIVSIKHNDEILNASKRAKEKLPELRKKILAGLKPGERLLLKGPFDRDDGGNEWMWVEVMDWKDEGKVQGILQNDPFYIKKLKAGMPVTIKTSDVFDYIYIREDGTAEGNETGKLMQKQQGEVRTK